MLRGTGSTVDVSAGSSSQDLCLDSQRILRSAIYASGCSIGILLVGAGKSLQVKDVIGAKHSGASLDPELKRTIVELLPSQIHIFDGDTFTCVSAEAGYSFLKDSGPIRFLAVTKVFDEAGQALGALIIADGTKRSGLSAAQQYVFLTQAAQLARLLDTDTPSKDVNTHRSVTERLRLLESVVVHANDAVLITEAEPIDLPGPRIVYVNKAFEKATGYLEQDVIGESPRILQSDKIDRAALDRLRAALVSWKPIEVELLNRRKDGVEFWVELSIVPVANEKGWFTHWVSVQRDVSHRKRAEEVATRARVAEAENRAFVAEIRERKLIETRLLHEAYHDNLTTLRNRPFFMERLTFAIEDAENRQRHNTIIFLDLDGFKLVNDSLGHNAGDLLLMEVARRLRACVRAQDTLARIGGDEFAVLLEGESVQSGIEVADRMTRALREPIRLASQQVYCHCSIGIAQSDERPLRPDEFLRNADIAMYKAKREGNGSFSVFTEAMHTEVAASLVMRTELREAVDRSEFRLYFQPIINLATSQVIGLEALVRWEHPTRGIVSPYEFIFVAEEIGIIRDIGRWVLREACLQLAVWERHFKDFDLRLNVNVSGSELRDPDFVRELQDVLNDSKIQPQKLHLEITEGVFLTQPDLIGSVLTQIRSLGVRVALDDFGTGFSSLGYIDRFEVDAIKIDKSFVARMLTQRRTLAIIQTIINLGRALDLKIVAEGVESEEQLCRLRSLGCAYAQGYLFAKPMPLGRTTEWLGGRHVLAGS